MSSAKIDFISNENLEIEDTTSVAFVLVLSDKMATTLKSTALAVY